MDYLASSLLQLAQSDTDSNPFPTPFVLVAVLEHKEAAVGPGPLPGTQGCRAGGYQL